MLKERGASRLAAKTRVKLYDAKINVCDVKLKAIAALINSWLRL